MLCSVNTVFPSIHQWFHNVMWLYIYKLYVCLLYVISDYYDLNHNTEVCTADKCNRVDVTIPVIKW